MTAAQLAAISHRAPGAPLAWLKVEEMPTAYRACYRCTHGADVGIERVCTHPELLHWGVAQPVAITRNWGGGCGPDALRMRDPSIQE